MALAAADAAIRLDIDPKDLSRRRPVTKWWKNGIELSMVGQHEGDCPLIDMVGRYSGNDVSAQCKSELFQRRGFNVIFHIGVCCCYASGHGRLQRAECGSLRI